MSDSSVPSIEFTQTGLLLPTEAAILSGVQADQNAAFGGKLTSALTTPQGQLASSTTAIIGDKNNKFAYFVNQVNPDYAEGFMQDAIARIYYLTRNPARPTAVQCECTGLEGTPIPVGAQARSEDGNIYICTAGGTIPVSGTITLSFACAVDGPIICPADTVNRIYRAIPGWDTINNSTEGVPGALVESRADFAYRRQQSVALNAHGSLASIFANVLAVPDVLDGYAYENTTNAPILVGETDYSLSPHSIYIAAVGGAAADIAQAIWEKKNDGSDMNGNTTVTVTDQTNYAYPYPSYPIKFNIPTSTPILFAVEIVDDPSLPSDIIDLIKAAIVAAFSGADGGPRARIGSTIFASRYYTPVSALGPAVGILSILVGIITPTLNSVTMGIDEAPTVTESDISVTLV